MVVDDCFMFVFEGATPTEIYTLSLHDALPISREPAEHRPRVRVRRAAPGCRHADQAEKPWQRRLVRSEEHTSELQSRFDLVCRLLLEKKNACSGSTRAVAASLGTSNGGPSIVG